jgi:Uma2 family endonuclease
MATKRPKPLIAVAYEEAAREYLRSLPPAHFMEAIGQSTQREITLESLALVRARRPDVHVFNELLVQYPLRRQRRPGQVVPDNMVIICDKPIKASTSYNLPLEPARPFWVLEYVSKSNKRKDYDDNFDKYEQQLMVPYYLIFYPDDQELCLYHLKADKQYVSVKPNKHGRYSVKELDVEVALLDGWVRFWYQGELLPLPADLQRALEQAKRRAEHAEQRAEHAEQRAEQAERSAAENAQRADALQRRLDEAERRLAQHGASAQPSSTRRSNGAKPSGGGG